MKLFTKILILNCIFFLVACTTVQNNKITKKKEKQYYTSRGFALIYQNITYDQGVINKKLKNEGNKTLHSSLRRNTNIKIFNPENSKYITTKVSGRAKYPGIYNIVINKNIANALELDFNNPYVEVVEIKKNKTFIAKKSNTFDEEKNVAETAPVDEIRIDDLNENTKENKKKSKKINNFILVISDFYYLDSANNLKDELIKKTQINNFMIKKINDNKYRLSVGPFNNFNALKSTYISLNNLGFEELNVYNE